MEEMNETKTHLKQICFAELSLPAFADCAHEEEGFRQGRARASMGTRAEDPPRAAPAGDQDVHRAHGLHTA